MANTVNQWKLQRLVHALQTTEGTPEPLVVSGPAANPLFAMLPITEDASVVLDRGTGIIDRANTIDGFAGAMCGVPGSFGYSVGMTVELHEENDGGSPAEPVPYPYWVRLLLASGYSALYEESLAGDFTVTLTPSERRIRDLTSQALGTADGTVYGPYVSTANWLRYSDTETLSNSYRFQSHDLVFTDTWTFTAGERAQIQFEGVGKLAGTDPVLSIPSEWAYPSVQYPDGVGCSPWVVKNLTVTIDGQSPLSLASLEFSSGASLDDVLDPRQENGFGTSPVNWTEAPTLSFDLAEQVWNSAPSTATALLSRFRRGETVAIEVLLTSPSGDTTLTLSFPRVQYSEAPAPAARENFASYSVTGRVVRTPGAPSQYTIVYAQVP